MRGEESEITTYAFSFSSDEASYTDEGLTIRSIHLVEREKMYPHQLSNENGPWMAGCGRVTASAVLLAVASLRSIRELARARLAVTAAVVRPASVAARARAGIRMARDLAGVMLTLDAVWKAGKSRVERSDGRGGR